MAELFIGEKPNAEIGRETVVPPVDLNVPVTNPALVAALVRHRDTKTEQSEAEIRAEFKRATFLLAINLDRPPTPTSEGQAIFQKGQRIAVVQVVDSQDRTLLALFTDHAEKLLFTTQSNSTLVMPARQAMEFAVESGYAGLVVNPATLATMRLDAPALRKMLTEM